MNRHVNAIAEFNGAVPARCEWGHDDYSLKVENLPKAPPPKGQPTLFGEGVPK